MSWIYGPALPFPLATPTKAWAWAVAPVSVRSAPTNPAGAEQVREVQMLDLASASTLLTQTHAWYVPLLQRATIRFPHVMSPPPPPGRQISCRVDL